VECVDCTDHSTVFFICFRECVECSIIVSVLLSFLKQTLDTQDPTVYKKLRAQVWWGIGLGLLVCLIIGGAFIGAFYGLGEHAWNIDHLAVLTPSKARIILLRQKTYGKVSLA
jgi:FTR1 family protein